MRTKQVIMMRIDGATDRIVISAMICIRRSVKSAAAREIHRQSAGRMRCAGRRGYDRIGCRRGGIGHGRNEERQRQDEKDGQNLFMTAPREPEHPQRLMRRCRFR